LIDDFWGKKMSKQSESSKSDANCTVLQFCSAVHEGLDGIANESFAAENFGYKGAAGASSCPQSTAA
jgi:hypothetical protein